MRARVNDARHRGRAGIVSEQRPLYTTEPQPDVPIIEADRPGQPWEAPFVDISPTDDITITLTLDPVEGATGIIHLPLSQVIAVRHLLTTFGDQGSRFALDIALLGQHVKVQKPTQEESTTEIVRIMRIIEKIKRLPDDLPELLSYHALTQGSWTRKEAAKHASMLLGRTIESSTWRKHLDAYAHKRGWPKIDLPTGRRRKSEKV